jgi:hypothetical protein
MYDIHELNQKHYKLQRIIIGICGMILAPLSLAFGYLGEYFGNNISPQWMNSISQTFYATSNVLMIGILFIAGLFLITYLAPSKLDSWINHIIGWGFLGVALFPTASAGIPDNIGLFQLSASISNILHFVFAGIAFILMGYNCAFLFTKNRDEIETDKKRIRNIIYFVCGISIWITIFLMVLLKLLGITGMFIMWGEWAILTFFGIAWIIKSGAIGFLND